MRRVTIYAVVLATAGLLAACGGDDPPGPSEGTSLPTRTVEVGEVTVEIEPTAITSSDATFEVVFDTHSVELDLDVAANAPQVVDGVEWTGATWAGAGPGGHHREGTLTFDAAGDPAGRAALTIAGLADPIEASWDLEAS